MTTCCCKTSTERYTVTANEFVVIRDLNPVRFQLRQGTLQSATWVRDKSAANVASNLAAAEKDKIEEMDREIREVLGPETVIINIVDGDKRPAAKAATLSDRHRRFSRRHHQESSLPCGKKRVELEQTPSNQSDWIHNAVSLCSSPNTLVSTGTDTNSRDRVTRRRSTLLHRTKRIA